MKEKYLPIGTVCRLKGGVKPLMIIGFCVPNPNDANLIMDYNGCLYPEGIIGPDRNLLFNHENIDKVFFEGFSDEEDVKFKAALKEIVARDILNQEQNMEVVDNQIVEPMQVVDNQVVEPMQVVEQSPVNVEQVIEIPSLNNNSNIEVLETLD